MTCKCSGLSTFGHISAITAVHTAASMSRKAWCQGRLILTKTSAPALPTALAAAGMSSRPRCLLSSGTLSSRSRIMASAPRVCALATNFSRVIGTNNSERQCGRSVGDISDDPFRAQVGKVARADAEAGQDLLRMLAQLGGRAAQRARRCRQPWHDVVHGDAPNLLVGDFDDHLALLHVPIGDELVDVVDGGRGNLGSLEYGQALGQITLGNELADRPLRLLVVGKARAVADKAGILRHLGDADGRIEPFRHRLHRARNRKPAAVAGAVDIARAGDV